MKNIFNLNAECTKCGAIDISIIYCSGGTSTCYKYEEHIHRTCRRCGYNWTEMCLDSKEE